MTAHTLLLFDLDGVLIIPEGYKEALRATVDTFAAWMGQSPVGLTDEEIAFFEAHGMTSEWISGAMCVGAMLVGAATQHPDLARATFAATLEAIRERNIHIARPDFMALTREIHKLSPEGLHAEGPVLAYMLDRADQALHPVLIELLADVHPPDAPTSRVMQTYTLGHKMFAETFGMPPEFEVESYLKTLDSPGLSRETAQRLKDLVATEDCGMAIFTARPSRPPADLLPGELAMTDRRQHSPEGELAVELLGFDSNIPLIAAGHMIWLSTRRNKGPRAYVKPSPVQALAAIGAAHTGQEKAALEAAAVLAEDGHLEGPLAQLKGRQTRCVVFEDAIGGIQAGQRAVEVLKAAGVEIRFEGVGIASEESKQKALSKVASRAVDNVNEALVPYLIE